MSDPAPLWRLRLFLDAGAGVCLWSQDEATKARFGYPVDHQTLALTAGLLDALDQLIVDYDATINWDDPGASDPDGFGPAVFGFEPDAPFRERIQDLALRLREALGPDFEVSCDF